MEHYRRKDAVLLIVTEGFHVEQPVEKLVNLFAEPRSLFSALSAATA